MYAWARSIPEYETSNFFGGKTNKFNLKTEYEWEQYCTNTSLWYFLFNEGEEFYKYIGYFDIDLKKNTKLREAIKHDDIVVMKNEAKPYFDLFTEYGEVTIYSSGSKGFHVYVFDTKFIFKSKDVKKFTSDAILNQLHDILSKEVIDIIDTSVYAMNKGIRPVYQINPKTNRRPRLLWTNTGDDDDIINFIINNVKNSNALKEFHKPLILTTNPEKKQVFVQQQQQTSTNTKNTESQLLEMVSDKLGKKVDIKKRLENNNLIINTEWCFIKQGEHRTCKNYYVYNEPSNCYIQKCFSEKCKKINNCAVFELIKYNALSDPQFPEPFQRIALDPEEKYLPSDEISQAIEKPGSRVVIFKSMGGGKTTLMKNIVTDYIQNKKRRVLIISTRVIQSSIFKELYEIIPNYKDFTDNQILYSEPSLIICLYSLSRLLSIENEIPVYDLLVVDEVVSVVKTLIGSLLANSPKSNQNTIFEIFKLLLQFSKRVVFLDGIPTEIIYYFMKELFIFDKFVFYCGTDRSDMKKYYFYDSPAYFESIIENKLKNQSKIVVISNSKSILHAYSENLGSDNVMCITGDTPIDVKKTASKPNDNWSKVDLLLYNDALGPGADFSLPYYDCVFVVCTCETTTPVEILQLIGRIRNPIEQKVHLLVLDYMNKKEYGEIPSYEKELKNTLNKLVRFGNQANLKYTPVLGQKRTRDQAELGPLEFESGQCSYHNMMGVVDEVRPRLCFESNELIRLSTRDKLYRDQCRKTEFFLSEMMMMIRRNGGLVYSKKSFDCEVKKRRVHKTFKTLKKKQSEDIDAKKKCFWLVDLPDPVYFSINQITDLHNLESQLRFVAFFKMWVNPINFIIQDVERFYTKNEKHTKARKAFTNHSSMSVFTKHFKKLLSFFEDIEIKNEKFLIRGEITHQDLYKNYKELIKPLELIIEEIRKSNYGGGAKYYKCNPDRNPFEINEKKTRTNGIKALVECIESIFFYVGMPLQREKYLKNVRYMVNGNKLSSSYCLCVYSKVVDLRRSLYGISPESGDTKPKEQCIKDFLLKYSTK